MSQHQCDQPQENTPESSEGNDQQTPFLEEKTLYLLKALGQTQSWLSQQVGWKDRSSVSQAFEKGRIPTTKYSEWCNALQVPAKILELPNIDAFKEAVEATQDSRVDKPDDQLSLEAAPRLTAEHRECGFPMAHRYDKNYLRHLRGKHNPDQFFLGIEAARQGQV